MSKVGELISEVKLGQKLFDNLLKLKEYEGIEIVWKEEPLEQGRLPKVDKGDGNIYYPPEFYAQCRVDFDSQSITEVVQTFMAEVMKSLSAVYSEVVNSGELNKAKKFYMTHRGVNVMPIPENSSAYFISALLSCTLI